MEMKGLDVNWLIITIAIKICEIILWQRFRNLSTVIIRDYQQHGNLIVPSGKLLLFYTKSSLQQDIYPDMLKIALHIK